MLHNIYLNSFFQAANDIHELFFVLPLHRTSEQQQQSSFYFFQAVLCEFQTYTNKEKHSVIIVCAIISVEIIKIKIKIRFNKG